MTTMRERQKQVQLYRGQIPSPGAPTVAWREDRVRFWAAIARGVKTDVAAAEARVSSPVGYRWFRHAGGVNPCLPATVSGRYLSFSEREDIALLRARGHGVREIARRVGRSPSTISRELRRNASTRPGGSTTRPRSRSGMPSGALDVRRSRSWLRTSGCAITSRNDWRARSELLTVVGWGRPDPSGQGRTSRIVAIGDGCRLGARSRSRSGSSSTSPMMSRCGSATRRSTRPSTSKVVGALKRELVACLRTGRALRVPRARSRTKPWGHVTEDVVISQRPAEVEDRAVPGHWEGDLLIGLERSAIGTLVERTTRFTMLIHLPREDGYRHKQTPKNGPALAGYGAITMKNALAATMSALPEQLRRSLTWDRGKELSAHVAFKVETGIPVFFADPRSPWQRGTNENTNGLLRQYFPKGTDLSRWNADDIEAVAATLNARPRKILGWKTPAEALDEHLRSAQAAGVASID